MPMQSGPSAQRGMAYANKKGRHEAGLSVAIQTWSIPRTDRTTPAEAIVHADLDGMLVVAEAGADDLGGSAGESGVAEVVVLVFGLGGPVRGEHVFETGADGITVLVGAIGGKGGRHAGDTDTDIVVVAPGIAALGVEQRRTPSVAEPAGDRAKLVVICGDKGASGKEHAIVVVGKPAVLGLGTDHPVGCELVIEAALHAAHEPAAASLQAVVARERAAEVAADIEAGPVVNHLRRRIGRSLGVGARRDVRREGWRCECNNCGHAQQKFPPDSFPIPRLRGPHQTTWPQFGCLAAMPERGSFLTVTGS